MVVETELTVCRKWRWYYSHVAIIAVNIFFRSFPLKLKNSIMRQTSYTVNSEKCQIFYNLSEQPILIRVWWKMMIWMVLYLEKSVFLQQQRLCLPELMSRMLCGYAQLLGISLTVLNFVLVPVFLTLDSTCTSTSFLYPCRTSSSVGLVQSWCLAWPKCFPRISFTVECGLETLEGKEQY